ncbi:hypothetical protein [Streptomyces shenzhenensis]|uniref:hypothetical protein n=1 Tax=Streptomyces shenzhenensis TaxID=943815 RepID=UPI0036BC68DD
MSAELITAELHQDGECIARWTDADGPPDLAERLPRLREQGWTVHDFRDGAGPVRPDEETTT